MQSGVMDEVKKIFKPEFLNRIDETIVFHALNKEDMGKIVDIMLHSVSKRILDQMSITLQVEDDAKQFLIDKGYDPKYGARPLRRTIQNEIEDSLAEEILDGKITQGDRVTVTCKDGKLNYKVTE
jgi:ATP-dependent Clp protease ATP-binding subunit ClpC